MSRDLHRAAALCALALGCTLARGAAADEPKPPDAPKPAPAPAPPPGPAPWQVGVTAEAKAAAQAALDRGNDAFAQNDYARALDAYRAGLASWDHPSIRFNLAVTLIRLGRPLEAQDELDKAMAYGPTPLGDSWREAVTYQTLLAGQIATITVTCAQPVELTLDAAPLGPCPGAPARRVQPGDHVVVAQRAGYLTETRRLTVVGGTTPTVALELRSLRDAAVTRTRWSPWKPWAAAAAGVGVAAIGLGFELSARGTQDDYRRALQAECGDRGCAGGVVSVGTAHLATQARLDDRIGVSLLVVGGVGVAAGVTLLVLNRAHAEIPGPAGQPLAIAPVVGPDQVGLVVAGAL